MRLDFSLEALDDYLSRRRPRGVRVCELADGKELQDIWDLISEGGELLPSSEYPGIRALSPDRTEVDIRLESDSVEPTIDIIPRWKKQNQGPPFR